MGGMPSGPGMGMPGMGWMGSPMILNPSYVDQAAFTQVGQALWMLFLSWLGGTVAFLLFRSSERSSSPPVPQ